MTTIELDTLRYPIGKFTVPTTFSDPDIQQWIHRLDHFPATLRKEVMGLSDLQLDTRYRDGGWTIRQVVHHVADSHLNAYIRFKLGMTEDTPTIRPYFEDRWAEQADGKKAPVEISLSILESLHTRWVYFLRSIPHDGWSRKYYHPEAKREYTLWHALALYAWHGDHHLAHVTQLKKRQGW